MRPSYILYMIEYGETLIMFSIWEMTRPHHVSECCMMIPPASWDCD